MGLRIGPDSRPSTYFELPWFCWFRSPSKSGESYSTFTLLLTFFLPLPYYQVGDGRSPRAFTLAVQPNPSVSSCRRTKAKTTPSMPRRRWIKIVSMKEAGVLLPIYANLCQVCGLQTEERNLFLVCPNYCSISVVQTPLKDDTAGI